MAQQEHAPRRDPEQPSGAFDLTAAARDLLEQAKDQRSGRAARTLTPGAGASLKQTVLALTAGHELDEHPAPGPSSLVVLRGTVTLSSSDGDVRLDDGKWAAVPQGPHRLRAETDAAVLLTVAMPAGR